MAGTISPDNSVAKNWEIAKSNNFAEGFTVDDIVAAARAGGGGINPSEVKDAATIRLDATAEDTNQATSELARDLYTKISGARADHSIFRKIWTIIRDPAL